MKKAQIAFYALAGTIAVGAVVAATPVFGSAKRLGDKTSPTPAVQKALAERKRYEVSVEKADVDFLTGSVEKALAGYEAAKALPARLRDPAIDLKMGTCLASLGRYDDALMAFRSAEKASPIAASTGLVDAQIALLAHKHDDPGTLQDVVRKAVKKYTHGGKLRPDVSLTSGPGETGVPEAQVYLVFARAFVTAYQREGVDFAYGKALALTGRDPKIAKEYAFFLRSRFHDPAAEVEVLNNTPRPKDRRLALDLKFELQDARQAMAFSSSRQKAEVQALKRTAFQLQGVY